MPLLLLLNIVQESFVVASYAPTGSAMDSEDAIKRSRYCAVALALKPVSAWHPHFCGCHMCHPSMRVGGWAWNCMNATQRSSISCGDHAAGADRVFNRDFMLVLPPYRMRREHAIYTQLTWEFDDVDDGHEWPDSAIGHEWSDSAVWQSYVCCPRHVQRALSMLYSCDMYLATTGEFVCNLVDLYAGLSADEMKVQLWTAISRSGMFPDVCARLPRRLVDLVILDDNNVPCTPDRLWWNLLSHQATLNQRVEDLIWVGDTVETHARFLFVDTRDNRH